MALTFWTENLSLLTYSSYAMDSLAWLNPFRMPSCQGGGNRYAGGILKTVGMFERMDSKRMYWALKFLTYRQLASLVVQVV